MFWENRGSAYEFSGQSWFGFLSEVDLGVLSPSCEIGMAVQCWCLGTMLRSRGLVGSWAGKVAQQSALFPYGSLSVWCHVSLVRRCFLPLDAAPHYCSSSSLFIFIAVCPVPFRSVALAHYPSRSRLPRGRSFASVTDFSDGLASLIEQMYY